MQLPSTQRAPLAGQHFQVAVIGGGIVGMAIARACARAGKRTLLVEQHDFGSGTTSRSSRLLSGLHALEKGDLAFARESVRERERLLRERSHLASPAHFLFALSGRNQRSAMAVRTSLWLYRRLTGRTDPVSFELEHKKLERALDAGQRWTIFDYEDAQCEFPERLVAEWLVEAIAAGAVARNHTQVMAIDAAHGRARGLLLRDWTRNLEEKVEATWIINATGPWADRTCQRSGLKTRRPLVSGVRGSHIVLSQFPGAPGTAVYAQAIDGEPLYVVPWNEQILVGATHVADGSDPAKVYPSQDEIDYLLRSLTALFPKARVSAGDLRHAFAGVRNLPFDAKGDTGHGSRAHSIHDHAQENVDRLLSVVGGNLSTAQSVAADVLQKIGLRAGEVKTAAAADDAMLNLLLDEYVAEVANVGNLNEEAARAMVEWHGKRALGIARSARASAELRTTLCPHTPHIVAEAVSAYRTEEAVTLGDVLLRRVPVALGPCWSEACSREAALRIAAAMGWKDDLVGANLEALEMESSAFLRKPRAATRMATAAD
jgi:glycerol-3-phosphate dehydrogenase